jgi:hypothetical protein
MQYGFMKHLHMNNQMVALKGTLNRSCLEENEGRYYECLSFRAKLPSKTQDFQQHETTSLTTQPSIKAYLLEVLLESVLGLVSRLVIDVNICALNIW